MARPLRIEYDGALYHVTSRGNERKSIFRDDRDRTFFLDTLGQVTRRFHWICYTYCLMNNHYHLVIETPNGNLSKGMRQLNGIYTQAFNRRHRRVGHLFQGRFKAVVVQKDSHFLEVCRYVVLNPVRAKSVRLPREWKWSSYRASAGMASPHPCLTVKELLSHFGNRIQRYRDFVQEGIGKGSIWDELRGQSLLGAEEFVEKLLPYVEQKREIKEVPKSQRYLGRPSLKELFASAATRTRRNRIILQAVHNHGYSQVELADFLGLHYSTISRIIKSRKQQK